MHRSWHTRSGHVALSVYYTDVPCGFIRAGLMLALWKLTFSLAFNRDTDEMRYANPYWLGKFRSYFSASLCGLSFTTAWAWPEKKFLDSFDAPCRNIKRPTYHDLKQRIEELEGRP